MPTAKKSKEKEKKDYPFKMLLIWGRLNSGKTLAALSSPVEPKVIVDLEESSTLFFKQKEKCKSIGINLDTTERYDCLTQAEYFATMKELKVKYPPGENKIGTLIIDPYSQAEDYHQDYFFGLQSTQHLIDTKRSALAWGHFKDMMRAHIREWKTMCKLLILISHSRAEFVSNAPTGEYMPKCGDVAKELTEMMVMLHREPSSEIPDGFTTPPRGKSRILGLPSLIPDFTLLQLEDFLFQPPCRPLNFLVVLLRDYYLLIF